MQDASRIMEKQSSAIDNLLLFLGALLLLCACATIIGIVPVAILVAGLVLTITSKNIANVRVTTRFLQALLIAGAVALAATALYNANKAAAIELPVNPESIEDPEIIDFSDSAFVTDKVYADQQAADQYYVALYAQSDFQNARDSSVLGSLAALVAAAFFSILWLRPITRQFDNLTRIFSRNSLSDRKERSIISRQKMAAFSIADELIKWNELKKEGLVSDQEFNEARDRLLGSS